MPAAPGARLTDVNPIENPAVEFPASRLFVVLLPLIVAATVTAAFAAVAALLRWHRDEMLLIAAAAGAAAVLPALVLVYLQRDERKVLRHAAANFAARVSGIVESAMDAIITVDEQQRIVQFNAAAESVFRWPRNAVIGQQLDMLLPERFRARHQEHIHRFAATATTSRGMGTRMVLHGLRADGQEFPIEASISQHAEDGRKLFTVILRDVTATVQAEEQLARGEARLRGILESAMDAIITIDEKNHVVLFNKAAEDVFGCPREQAIGAPLEWFIPERYRAAHSAHVRRFGETGVSSRRMGASRIVMGLRRNGEEFPIDASISQITEDGQRFYTVILRDVTERWLADEALKASREEIRGLALSANNAREQEKARVARELHDELGQALTALKIDVTWMRDNVGGAPEAVKSKLAAMQGLIDGTVTSARRISSELRPLMLDDLGLVAACDWLAQNFRQRTDAACELVIGEGELDLPEPHATAVFRVLQESLTNATKHAQATQVEVTLERAGEEIVLTVRDNGKGFAPGQERKPHSHGLSGLRERASLLNGSLLIDSAPGRGTLIELRLPAPEIERPS
jgi:PAS domain S-box-containing protein